VGLVYSSQEDKTDLHDGHSQHKSLPLAAYRPHMATTISVEFSNISSRNYDMHMCRYTAKPEEFADK